MVNKTNKTNTQREADILKEALDEWCISTLKAALENGLLPQHVKVVVDSLMDRGN
jgi:hypothetical protein